MSRSGIFHRRLHVIGGAAALLAATPACVERTVRITTEPEGAAVFLNDQEVGNSPVKVPFTWYGDYDIVLRKPGYQAVHTNHRLETPWYQYPLIDLFAECFVPFTIYDHREIGPLVIEPFEAPAQEDLLRNAAQLKEEALYPSAE